MHNTMNNMHNPFEIIHSNFLILCIYQIVSSRSRFPFLDVLLNYKHLMFYVLRILACFLKLNNFLMQDYTDSIMNMIGIHQLFLL